MWNGFVTKYIVRPGRKILQSCRAIQYCKLIVVSKNILRMSCLWLICTIFCSWCYGVDSREWTNCHKLQNRSLQVLYFYFRLPFIAETFQRRTSDGGLSCEMAFLMSIVRQKIPTVLRIQAFRDLTLSGGRVFPGRHWIVWPLRSFGSSVTASHPRSLESSATSALWKRGISQLSWALKVYGYKTCLKCLKGFSTGLCH
jgi:hypothetical protein